MVSRSKRLIQLAVAAETAGISMTVVGTKKEAMPNVEDTTSITDDVVSSKNIVTNATDDVAVQKDDSTVSNRRRCDSTSSSSSSSSDSSSSGPSFIEDSDDSVKDPNYEAVVARYRTLSSSDSDIEDVNVSILNQDSILHDKLNLIPTPTRDDDMIILSNIIQEPDVHSMLNEPSSVDFVSAAQEELINLNSSPNKTGRKRQRQEGNWKMNFSLSKDEENNTVKLAEIKVIRVQKSDPKAIFFKNSYADTEFKKAIGIKKKKNNSLELKNAYNQKPGLSDRKKADLMDLVNKNLIPRYYKPFYESL